MALPSFSTSWKSSTQPRKQHKYIHHAPLHTKQKSVHVHLSPELRKKYHFRNVQVRKGDKVKLLRGQFAKKEGKVDIVDLKWGKLFVTGIEQIKKDGTKRPYPLHPHNLMILELDLGDKYRKAKLESKSSPILKSSSSPISTANPVKSNPIKSNVPESGKPIRKTTATTHHEKSL